MSTLLRADRRSVEFNVLREYASSNFVDAPGARVLFRKFHSGVNFALQDRGLPPMSAARLINFLNADGETPVGYWHDNQRYVGNIAEQWETPSLPWKLVDGRLRRMVA